jgi:hypothetical protein
MLPFDVTLPPTVPQRSDIPEGLTNYSILLYRHNGHSNIAVHNKDENDLTIQLSLAMFSNISIENAYLEMGDLSRTKSEITQFSATLIMQTIQAYQTLLLCEIAEL